MRKDLVEEVRKDLFCAKNAKRFEKLTVVIRRYSNV